MSDDKAGGIWSNGDRYKLMAIMGIIAFFSGGASSVGVRWWNPELYDAYTGKMALADRLVIMRDMRKERQEWHDRWVRNVYVPLVNVVNEQKQHAHNQTALELGMQSNATELARVR
ncbi:hypothetical protein, partial [Neptunomonas sp.]|uniref:hypothetical protein n=1 Tax=Neptunomonas sp. TaxID=1971898 RepID=UPI003565D6BA